MTYIACTLSFSERAEPASDVSAYEIFQTCYSSISPYAYLQTVYRRSDTGGAAPSLQLHARSPVRRVQARPPRCTRPHGKSCTQKKMRWPGPIVHSTSCMSATLNIEDLTATTRSALLPLPTAGDAPGGLRAHTGGTPPGPRRQLDTDKSSTPSAPPASRAASQCPTNCICIPPSLRHPAGRRRPFNSRP